MWGCKPHWFKLSREIRQRIWDTYVSGQERRKDPTEDYLQAVKAARDFALEQNRKEEALRSGKKP